MLVIGTVGTRSARPRTADDRPYTRPTGALFSRPFALKARGKGDHRRWWKGHLTSLVKDKERKNSHTLPALASPTPPSLSPREGSTMSRKPTPMGGKKRPPCAKGALPEGRWGIVQAGRRLQSLRHLRCHLPLHKGGFMRPTQASKHPTTCHSEPVEESFARMGSLQERSFDCVSLRSG